MEEAGFSKMSAVGQSAQHHFSEHCNVCDVILAPPVCKIGGMVTFESMF
jgi:hypothetical protein